MQAQVTGIAFVFTRADCFDLFQELSRIIPSAPGGAEFVEIPLLNSMVRQLNSEGFSRTE